MLHILFFVLKIIGILLAVVVGIVFLILFTVLFIPIRYEASSKYEGTLDTLKVKAKIHWFFNFIRADVFVKGTKLKWKLRFAWINKSNAMSLENQKEVKKHGDTKSTDEVHTNEERTTETKTETIKTEDANTSENAEAEKNVYETSEDNALETEVLEEECGKISDETEKTSFSDKIQEIIQKIKAFLEKKEKFISFLEEKSHVHAFKKTKKELFVLLKKLKPDKVAGNVRFGFEDPCVTGQVLAVISILYPVFEDSLAIIPDFEHQRLNGTLHVKGRIRLNHFAVLAIKLFICKDVRKSYKDIKNFKL